MENTESPLQILFVYTFINTILLKPINYFKRCVKDTLRATRTVEQQPCRREVTVCTRGVLNVLLKDADIRTASVQWWNDSDGGEQKYLN